ncbi:DNA adenine methylase [Hymenobacter sp. B81]|uniref:DNA adenine methylase n=1 Tax=Hymenobacter sp. B81 TaxID=3344878 RepID=UPI0037DC11BE
MDTGKINKHVTSETLTLKVSNESFKRAPFLSPFRYPGGKTWLVPLVKRWISSRDNKCINFHEPFCGGAIVGLNVLVADLCENLYICELDRKVAAVWQTILSEDVAILKQRISDFDITPENSKLVLSQHPVNKIDLAFWTILKNRVSRGGVIKERAGLLLKGENGKGISSRWYPQTLINRIDKIHSLRKNIIFTETDALNFIKNQNFKANDLFFIDPPYTADNKKIGKHLYDVHELNHDLLFEIIKSKNIDFIMTYDDNLSVRYLTKKHGFHSIEISTLNSHNIKKKELLIGKDLDWVF